MSIVKKIEDFLDNDYSSLEENLRQLLDDYQKKEKRLARISMVADKQQRGLVKLNDELNDHKNNLKKKVEEEIAKREEKEKMLLVQSRLASMGEMIDAIAHQWKQPIGVINLQVQMMNYDFDDGLIDKEYISSFQEKVQSQIDHIVTTLDEFRSFFRPTKNSTNFSIKNMIERVFLLVKDEFIKNSIELALNIKNDFEIYGN